MAKTGFWLKGAKGKLAGTTLYKDASGETIMREVVSPSNPKTVAQNVQRIIMLTVGQAYSAMKEICDHSFEGVKPGRDTMAYFMKQNIQFCREKLAQMQAQGVDYYNMFNFLPLGMKGLVVNQYQIAMGSLPQIECGLLEASNTMAFVPAATVNTYAGIINKFGLQRGDQLTFVFLRANPSSVGTNVADFKFARVILDPTNEDYTQAPLDTPFIVEGRINKPSVRNEGDFRFVADEHNGLGFESRLNNASPCVAAAVIVSRKVGDQWNRSTTYLTYLPDYNAFSMGDCLYRAAQGVNSPLYTPNALYLNNAGEGGGAATEAGSDAPGGDTPGGGGGGTPSTQPVINSLSVDGSPAIQGTQKDITKAEGTEFPVDVVVAVNTSNLNGNFLVIKQGDTEAASVAISNNAASATVHAAKDAVYTVEIQNEDSEVVLSTNYSFVVSEEGMNED